MLREYKTIQQNKFACQIEETGKIEPIKDAETGKTLPGRARYTNKRGAITELMEFTHDVKQKPEVGDYIVKQSEDDIYLVKQAVFEKSYRPAGFKLA